MQAGIYAYSDQVKAVRGYKLKAPIKGILGKMLNPILHALNLHMVALPMPTQLPVWLRGEIDSNYILMDGIPHIDNKDDLIIVRIMD